MKLNNIEKELGNEGKELIFLLFCLSFFLSHSLLKPPNKRKDFFMALVFQDEMK